MRYFVNMDGEEHVVEITELPGGRHEVRLLPSADADSASVPAIVAELSATGRDWVARVAGRVFDVVLGGELPNVEAFASGHRATLQVETSRMRDAARLRSAAPAASSGVVTSPMPGKVVKILVREGDAVEAGAPVIVVEAMKMENELVAERAGTVQKIHVAPGDAVEGGAKLLTVGS
jgi:biotin carboxyl carrier protein